MTILPPHETAPLDAPLESPPPDEPRPRKPWAAGLLSFLVPGLGDLYAGMPRRALAVWLGTLVVAVVGLYALLLIPGAMMPVAMVLLGVAVQVLVVWDAVRSARRARSAGPRPAYDHWYVYAAIVVVSIFVWQPRYVAWLHANVVNAYRIASQSMEPTLLSGDFVFTVPLRGAVRRGDLIVHTTPAGAFIKRVVAVPGDTVSMRDGELALQGHPMRESYVRWSDTTDVVAPEFDWQRRFLTSSVDPASYRPSVRNWGPLVVPPDAYFLLGDNRNQSLDSRYLGFEPRAGLIARPTIIYFSVDSEAGVRWARIGRHAY